MYIYIYIHTERKRDMYICIYIYIYTPVTLWRQTPLDASYRTGGGKRRALREDKP